MFDFGFDLAGRREPRLLRGLCWGILAALAETLPYLQLYRALARVFAGQATAGLALETLLVLAGCNLALIALKARANVENFGGVYTLVADARLSIADRLSQLPMGVFLARRRAAIAELLTGRYAHYQEIIARVWGLSIMNAAVPGLLWLLLCALHFPVAILCGALGPLAFLAIPWSHRLLSRADTRLSALREQVVVAVLEQIESLRELRQFDRNGTRLARTKRLLADLEREQMQAELAPAPALLVFGFLLQAGFAGAALAGAYAWAKGQDASTYLVVLVIALRYFRALGDLGLNLAELRHARNTLLHIRALAREPALPEPVHAREPDGTDICLREVGFQYPGAARPALSQIHGYARAGEFVALVGASGSGKSTLAALLARMWDPDQGALLIGGVNLRELSGDTLNRCISMVLQEVVLFEGSIADNIRLGRPEATIDEVRRAAIAAHAHAFIERLPRGYDTPVNPEAPGLSGGECQRLAIARAIVKNAPILILDEALANIDPDNAWQIQQALDALVQGRTVIMIAHQLRTVMQADQIWVLRDGQIVERGTHEALLAKDADYAALWQAQDSA